MVNLSPFSDDYPWQKALRDARQLVGKPDWLRVLVNQTQALFARRSEELREVEPDLHALWKVSERIAVNGRSDDPDDFRSVAALIYLLNPYDEKFDGIAGIGLRDDVAIVRMTAGGRGKRVD